MKRQYFILVLLLILALICVIECTQLDASEQPLRSCHKEDDDDDDCDDDDDDGKYAMSRVVLVFAVILTVSTVAAGAVLGVGIWYKKRKQHTTISGADMTDIPTLGAQEMYTEQLDEDEDNDIENARV
jgi:hypothetical protein